MSTLPGAIAADRLRIDSITGVPIELPIAGPGGRSFAFIIDWHIRVLIAAAWMFPMTLLSTTCLRTERESRAGSSCSRGCRRC